MEDNEERRAVWSCSFLSGTEESGVEALEEQLCLRELPFWQDASALRSYLKRTGLSQADGAKRLGRSQAAVANRLRLLKLPEEVRREAETLGISERHARALLRLNGEAQQKKALSLIGKHAWTVAETEHYVEQVLSDMELPGDEVFAPLLSELRSLHARIPSLTFSVSESPERIELVICFPVRDV